MKVLHLASHEINVGDGALNDAIRRRLQAQTDRSIDFTLMDVAVDPPELTADDLDAFDLVLVGGGGSISNGKAAVRTGTAAPFSLEAYAATRTRVAFVALGHNLFHGDPYRHGAALTRLLAIARDKGDPFSVRNDRSLERLRRDVGEAADGVVSIPDPGFFVEAPPLRPLEVGPRPYVIIQPAADGLGRRIGKPAEARQGFIDALAETGVALWREAGTDVLIAPHIRADAALSATLLDAMYDRAGPAAKARPFRMGGTPHPSHASRFFGGYAAAEAVIGMRGHAVICGVGLNVPTLALSTHPKVEGFMHECGLADWTVTLEPDLAANLTCRTLSLLDEDRAAWTQARAAGAADFADRFDRFLGALLA